MMSEKRLRSWKGVGIRDLELGVVRVGMALCWHSGAFGVRRVRPLVPVKSL